ncbi:MAG: hypothetical protein V4695_10100 [Pseudomonadota bacterium]
MQSNTEHEVEQPTANGGTATTANTKFNSLKNKAKKLFSSNSGHAFSASPPGSSAARGGYPYANYDLVENQQPSVPQHAGSNYFPAANQYPTADQYQAPFQNQHSAEQQYQAANQTHYPTANQYPAAHQYPPARHQPISELLANASAHGAEVCRIAFGQSDLSPVLPHSNQYPAQQHESAQMHHPTQQQHPAQQSYSAQQQYPASHPYPAANQFPTARSHAAAHPDPVASQSQQVPANIPFANASHATMNTPPVTSHVAPPHSGATPAKRAMPFVMIGYGIDKPDFSQGQYPLNRWLGYEQEHMKRLQKRPLRVDPFSIMDDTYNVDGADGAEDAQYANRQEAQMTANNLLEQQTLEQNTYEQNTYEQQQTDAAGVLQDQQLMEQEQANIAMQEMQQAAMQDY